MPYYQHERPQLERQYSGESKRTGHLLVKHQNQSDDDIFAGSHIRQSETMGSKRSKSTPLTVEESLSGEYQQFGVPRQPSMSYNDDDASYDQHVIETHRGRASQSENSYHSFQQGDFSYSGSYQDGDIPPEEEYYRDHYFSQQEGQCYTDDGEPYYGEDQEQYDQDYPYHEKGYSHNEQRQQPPYDDRGYHQGHPTDGYPHEYDQHYPEECDGYHHGHPDEYGDYQYDHPQDYPPEYHEANSQDYSGYRQDHAEGYHGFERGHQQQHLKWPQEEEYSHFDDQEESYISHNQNHQEEYSHFDDQEESYISHNQNNHYSSYVARQNAEGHWEESSEFENGTIGSKTLNTNLEGMKFMPREPYDNNYYGGEETAFDHHSDGPCAERSDSPDIPFNGASTLASPVHDDERSQGSASIWDGMDLRNRSLMDNPVSPLSQTQFTIGERTDYTGETKSTRRPVTRFIQKTKKKVVGCAGVTYDNGEFEVRSNSKRSGRSKTKRGESASILDIMLSVGHDLILGTKDKRNRRRRQRDPAAKIVDGFKEMFSCGVDEQEVDDYNDYESYRS